MITVTIQLKEIGHEQLALSLMPETENCTELEWAASLLLKKHIESAFNAIGECSQTGFSLDVSDGLAKAYQQALMGDK